MKPWSTLLAALMLILLSACQADVCPPDSIEYAPDLESLPTSIPELSSGMVETPELVQIGRRSIEVDRVVHGPLCNDTWSGTIYVACDVQVAAWDEEEGPFFLDGCELNIAADTVVYVAAHNNAAYYKGCASCHVSGGAEK